MGAMCRMIQPGRILIDISAESKEDCFTQLVSVLDSQGVVVDADLLLKDVMTREELSTTGLGSGCAVPHAHSEGIKETAISAARLTTPIDFSSEDGADVSLVFLMAGPKQNTGLHLKVLSKLARLLHDPAIREGLASASDQSEFYRLLCGEDE